MKRNRTRKALTLILAVTVCVAFALCFTGCGDKVTYDEPEVKPDTAGIAEVMLPVSEGGEWVMDTDLSAEDAIMEQTDSTADESFAHFTFKAKNKGTGDLKFTYTQGGKQLYSVTYNLKVNRELAFIYKDKQIDKLADGVEVPTIGAPTITE